MIGGKGLVGAFFFLIGTGFFLGSLWQVADTNLTAIFGTKTDGAITVMRRISRGGGRRRGGPCFRPIFTFVDDAGSIHRGAHSLCGPEGIYYVGEKITVHYAPNNPHNAIIGGFYGRFIFIFLALFAFPFAYFGAWLFLRDKREHAELGW